jgi:hypothetical protein
MRVPVQYQILIAGILLFMERVIPTIPNFPKDWLPAIQATLDVAQTLQTTYAALLGLDGRLLFKRVTIVNPNPSTEEPPKP